MLRVPAYLASGLEQSLLLVQDTNKPLPRVQVLDGGAAALVCSDIVFYRFLADHLPGLFKVGEDALTGLLNCQTGIGTR